VTAPSLLDYVSESDLDRLADVIADLLIAGARRRAAMTPDTAGSVRPLRAGDQPMQHEDRANPAKSVAVFEEDSHRAQHTPAAD
jgi:hypothetical protein